MPHGQPSDRATDRRNEHCFAYQRYSWKPTAAGTGGRADGPTIARPPPPETLFHSPDKLIRRPRSAVAAPFPPVALLRIAAPTEKIDGRIDFPGLRIRTAYHSHNTSTLRQVQCSFNDSSTLESGERQISQPRVRDIGVRDIGPLGAIFEALG